MTNEKPKISAHQIFEAEQSIKMLIGLTPTIIEEYAVRARLKREKFEALKREGFNEEQALQIVISGGHNLEL